MLPETIRSPPVLADFESLDDHQQKTPDSFFTGKPVLYYHATGAKAWLPREQLGRLPFFPHDTETAPSAPECALLQESVLEKAEQKVDVYVTSKTLIIFCPDAVSGLSIPYQCVDLHAVMSIGGSSDQRHRALYLQLELTDENGTGDDESPDVIDLTLIPTPIDENAVRTNGHMHSESWTTLAETTRLYDAIAACSNLNPDPQDDEDEEETEEDGAHFERIVDGHRAGVIHGAQDGGLPPPVAGSSGWITAENMHEYFDEDGNWIGDQANDSGDYIPEVLGEGAGVVRPRGQDTGEDGDVGHEDAANKRARTDEHGGG